MEENKEEGKVDIIKSKLDTTGLNLRQITFCELYVSKEFFGNGVAAYCEAYNIDTSKQGAYASARVCASELLTSGDILKYINALLDGEGFNDGFVDKQLLLAITQNADLSAKVAAIREYNKLKRRVENKLELHITKFDVKFNEPDKLE